MDSTCRLCLIVLVIAIIVSVVGFIIIAIMNIITRRKSEEAVIRMSQYTVNVQAIIDESIPNLLTSIITECFDDYKIMILYPKNEGYINDAREKEIQTDLAAKVTERLSPMALDKLSLHYNIANIGNIIADKIYIIVMNYVVEHNSVINNPIDKK